MRRIFNYVPSKATLMRGGMFIVILFVVVLLGSLWAVLWLAHENDILDERDRQSLADRADLRADLTAEETARKALEQQIRSLGEQPVVKPSDIPDDTDVVIVPGPKGDKGDRGESCIEEIGPTRCRGDAGTSGTDGSEGAPGVDGAPGPAGPVGPKGDPGEPGTDGKDGIAQPGTYACPEGEYMTGFGIASDGTVALVCQPVIPGNPGGNP